jgi:tetratricopeptide (TPR) repeat protein
VKRAWAVVALMASAARPALGDVPKALADFKAGRYMEATAELQTILDRSPGDAYAYFLLGHCLLRMQHPGDAEEKFRRAIEIEPRPEYFQGLALALKTSADWQHAIQTASDGLARAADPPTRFGLLVLRGYAYGAVSRWPEAARDFETARKIRSEPWLSVFLGKSYFSMGDCDRAMPPFQDAMGELDDDSEVLRLLAECDIQRAGAEPDADRKRGFYVDALEYARRLATGHPGDVDAIHLVGRAALGAGELAQAEKLFLHVLYRQPRQCYAMVNLGRTYIAMGRWDDAEASLVKAAACAPRMPVVFETLGDLYMHRGLQQQAVDAYGRAESLEPEPEVPTIPVRNPR